MENLQLRLEVRNSAQNWIATMLQEYGVPPTMIEDALQSALLNLKDIIAQELVKEVLSKQETPVQEVKEEQEDGGLQSDN